MVPLLDQCRTSFNGRWAGYHRAKSIRHGLVMGHDLFLWNLLVAHLSDDPLCAHQRLVCISAPAVAHTSRRCVPRPLLRIRFTLHRAVRRDCVNANSLPVGFIRLAALHSHGTGLECDWLLASLSSNDDSIRAMGRRLCRWISGPSE